MNLEFCTSAGLRVRYSAARHAGKPQIVLTSPQPMSVLTYDAWWDRLCRGRRRRMAVQAAGLLSRDPTRDAFGGWPNRRAHLSSAANAMGYRLSRPTPAAKADYLAGSTTFAKLKGQVGFLASYPNEALRLQEDAAEYHLNRVLSFNAVIEANSGDATT